ncbi:MAG: response regulator [Chitinispirillales bacterium]|nr:response regulator [Chitinispirillales bacterium]
MDTVFVVDDIDVNLAVVKDALEENYNVLTLPSAAGMFSLLQKITPDLILLDIEMPGMDGFAAMEKLKGNAKTANIPVMFLTASTDAAVEARGIKLGAVDFVVKPFSAPVLLNRIANHLHISELIKERTRKIELLQNGIVSVLANLVESRDEITGGHIERTSMYVKILLVAMQEQGVYAEQTRGWDVEMFVSAARMHDIGKIIVSDVILNKPGKLTDEEFALMKKHAAAGEQIIDQIAAQTDMAGDPFLENAKLAAGHHHEKWNGTGYPRGLKGEEISLQGRVMAVADVYDALVSDRPYKKAFSDEEAVNIISGDSGKHFDPKIVEVFLTVTDKFKNIRANICLR